MAEDIKVAIIDALVAIVSEGSLEDATINAICKKASVARRTLYRHFATKEDIVIGQLERDFVEPSRTFRASFPADAITQTNDILQMTHFLRMQRNLPFYRNLLASLGAGPLIDLISGVCTNYSRDVWPDYVENAEHLDYVTFLYSHITAASAVWWLDGHTDIDPHAMGNLMDTYGFAFWGAQARS